MGKNKITPLIVVFMDLKALPKAFRVQCYRVFGIIMIFCKKRKRQRKELLWFKLNLCSISTALACCSKQTRC